MNKTILKVLVGSQAHGLSTPSSDYDYRGVFVVPTVDILKIGSNRKNTLWIEDDTDNTAWEIGHFLQMAIKCNPTILEVFHAPIEEATAYGHKLRELFQYVWNTKDLINSHLGYGLNQRKKFLDDKDNRKSKYLVAYLRSLYQAYTFLIDGEYLVDMTHTSIFKNLKRFRDGDYEFGEALQMCYEWEQKLKNLESKQQINKETDLNKVNEFLLDIRLSSEYKYGSGETKWK
jgi:uncharacterized protein